MRLRSIETRSKIALLRFMSAATETGREYDGYWEYLSYIGKRSYDSLNMLKRHIRPDIYRELLTAMCQEDGLPLTEL